MAYRRIPENRLARLQRRITVDPDSCCWNWDKAAVGGYGVSSLDGKRSVAHRVVWTLLRGPIPDGLDLDHLCRNRLCVNPDHLEPVTRSENLLRGFAARGCRNGHMPEDQGGFSVVRFSNGAVTYRCKICHRAANKAAKQRKKMRCDGA